MMYLKKEHELLNAMKANDFAVFDGNQEDAYDALERIFNSFVNYANSVIRMTCMVPIWKIRYDRDIFQEKLEDIDKTRRIRHDAAISGIKFLNRLCEKHGLQPFTTVDTDDRHAVAAFIGSWISDIYLDGTSHSIDDLVTLCPNVEFPPHKMDDIA